MPGRLFQIRGLRRQRHHPGTGHRLPSGTRSCESTRSEPHTAFAEATGIDHLAIREPQLTGPAHFGMEPAIQGHGLDGLFPPDLSGFHDGADVPLSVALELVRAMLREHGAWCRLEVEDAFAVHVGWDQYIYVRSDKPCESALARTRALGLLAAILEEGYADNASRWHRLTENTLDAVRTRLAPRARLTVWPDLSTDITAVLAVLPDDGLVELVWEDANGAITSTIAERLPASGTGRPHGQCRCLCRYCVAFGRRRPSPSVHCRPARQRRRPACTVEDRADAE